MFKIFRHWILSNLFFNKTILTLTQHYLTHHCYYFHYYFHCFHCSLYSHPNHLNWMQYSWNVTVVYLDWCSIFSINYPFWALKAFLTNFTTQLLCRQKIYFSYHFCRPNSCDFCSLNEFLFMIYQFHTKNINVKPTKLQQ